MRLGHGEARAEQRDALAAVGDQLVGRRIGDVEHRHADVRRDRVIDLVPGVGGDDHALGAAASSRLRGLERDLARRRPSRPPAPSRRRAAKSRLSIARRRAVQPAEPLGDAAVDMLVIERGRRPARPADDAQLAQLAIPFPARLQAADSSANSTGARQAVNR